MSRPRRILPGQTHLLTRRSTHRLYLLRPDPFTTKIINYCLAEAAKRHGIDLIAWLFMSNHYHAVVHDPFGAIPAFLAHFHKMISKALNHRWARCENFWSSAETCVTLLPTHADVLRKVVYVLTNPAKANLVDTVSHWPGASSWRYMNGVAKEHARPAGYFRKAGRMPKSAKLRAVPPRASLDGERPIRAEVWREQVLAAVAEEEASLREARRLAGIDVLGRAKILEQEPTEAPSTEAPRCRMRPTLACHDKTMRKTLLATLKGFRAAHTVARLRFANGERNILFPAGTYRMRLLGARCKPPPD